MRQKLRRSGSLLTAGETTLDLAAYRSVCAVAIGKASVTMARGLTKLLEPDVLVGGILVAPHDSIAAVPDFRAIGAGHPLPDAGSLAAARAILDLLANTNDGTLIFFLLSGGGSALVELPLDPAVTLADLQELYRLLVGCGAPIDEINAVRKHVSAIKGGRLAAAAPTAAKLTIGVSDVPDGRESALASGPTLPDPTTTADACRVITQYDLMPKLSPAFQKIFGRPDLIPETPKPGDPAFENNQFLLLLGSNDLLERAREVAEEKRVRGRLRQFHRRLARRRSRRSSPLAARSPAQRQSRPPRRRHCRRRSQFAGNGRRPGRARFSLRAQLRRENSRKKDRGAQRGNRRQGRIQPRSEGAVADGATLERARTANLDPQEFERRSELLPISSANSVTPSRPAPPAIISETCASCSPE